jgi:hypothetical protein
VQRKSSSFAILTAKLKRSTVPVRSPSIELIEYEAMARQLHRQPVCERSQPAIRRKVKPAIGALQRHPIIHRAVYSLSGWATDVRLTSDSGGRQTLPEVADGPIADNCLSRLRCRHDLPPLWRRTHAPLDSRRGSSRLCASSSSHSISRHGGPSHRSVGSPEARPS